MSKFLRLRKTPYGQYVYLVQKKGERRKEVLISTLKDFEEFKKMIKDFHVKKIQ